MFNWEQLVQIVNLLKAQIREEGKCRLNSVSNTLDQLTKRNSLTMKQREEFLAGIHKALGEKVEHYEEGEFSENDRIVSLLLSYTTPMEGNRGNARRKDSCPFRGGGGQGLPRRICFGLCLGCPSADLRCSIHSSWGDLNASS